MSTDKSVLDFFRELLGGPGEPQPLRAMRNAASRFTFEVIRWSRGHGVHTHSLPENDLDRVAETLTLFGHIQRHRRWSDIAYAGFLAMVAGSLARLVAEGVSSTALDGIGAALQAVAGAAWLVAWRVWAKGRQTVAIAIFDGRRTVEASRLRRWIAAAEIAPAHTRWAFARGGFAPQALAFAEANALRCLVATHDGFEPPKAPAPSDHGAPQRLAA